MNDNQLADFKAPSWATHWCARCDWAQTCPDCRRAWPEAALPYTL